MGELSVLITLLAILQKWLFKSFGEISLVVLVFAGAFLLVSRLIARHVSFEFLLFVKMSAKKCFFEFPDHVGDFISLFFVFIK